MVKIFKHDIYKFLDKCEDKAISFITTKFTEKLELLKKDNRFKFVVEDFETYNNALKIVKEIMSKYKPSQGYQKGLTLRYYSVPSRLVSRDYWGYMSFNDADALLVAYITNYIEEFPDCSWVLTYLDDIDSIKSEYGKLNSVIKNTKSNKKCIELLKQLGYDVSSLDNVEENQGGENLDKSKLFVCKEGEI